MEAIAEALLEVAPSLATQIVDTARSYVEGGCESVPFDPCRPDAGWSPERGVHCSGFVSFVLNEVGLMRPPYVEENVTDRTWLSPVLFDCYGVSVHEQCVQPGDLGFLSATGQRPDHVFLVSGVTEEGLTIIHAPGSWDPTRDRVVEEELDPTKRGPINPAMLDPERADRIAARNAELRLAMGGVGRAVRVLYDKNPIGFRRPACITKYGRIPI